MAPESPKLISIKCDIHGKLDVVEPTKVSDIANHHREYELCDYPIRVNVEEKEEYSKPSCL